MIEKKISVALCVPITHTLPGAFFKHYMNFYLNNKDKYDLFPVCEVHYITDLARNRMIKKLLSVDNTPDYFLFIDSDMVFEPKLLDKLIEADKDVVSGLYFQKHRPYYPLSMKIKKCVDGTKQYVWNTNFKVNEIQEVDAVGAGALLVKSSVFDKVKSPWFSFLIDDFGCPVGEDIYFCKKLQDNGFKIWLHGGTIIDHVGNSMVNITNFSDCKIKQEFVEESITGLHPNSFETKDYFIL